LVIHCFTYFPELVKYQPNTFQLFLILHERRFKIETHAEIILLNGLSEEELTMKVPLALVESESLRTFFKEVKLKVYTSIPRELFQ